MMKSFSRPRWLVALYLLVPGNSALADEVSAGTFVHSDTNSTVVVNPHLRARVDLAESTALDLEYGIDVWTSASVDIMTSASKRPVTEQRDELNVGVAQEFEDAALSVGYRFSTENDYTSHGGSLTATYDFADNNATLGLTGYASFDQVGRAGEPSFSERVTNYGLRPSFTQVIDRNTLAQLTYELSVSDGYQSSPYRRVGIGGNGRCNMTAVLCIGEHNPEYRMRHAVALSARHAFGRHVSAGGSYRFYIDDWGLLSNTFSLDLAWLPRPSMVLGLRYRGYTQGAAEHYEARYFQLQQFVTSDKELSPLTSHRISLELNQDWELADMRKLSLLLSVAPIFYFYSDFVPISRITALQTNLALVVML